ncbi:MAG: hypothetical protein FJ026_00435 [Chloroflexi bacterium]|nr:hypothetical protein [Chloroflexota bacterium]
MIANLVDAVEQGHGQSVGERLEISPAALRHLCDNLDAVLKLSDLLRVAVSCAGLWCLSRQQEGEDPSTIHCRLG